MTIIELFPWLLAIAVAALTGTLLTHGGYSGTAVWVIAVVAGIALFAAYWFTLKSLAGRFRRKRAREAGEGSGHRK